MTAPRLTLESRERARWMSEHDAFLATRRDSLADDLGERADAWADGRILAYRERCAPRPSTEAIMDAGRSEGVRECARRLASVLDDEPNWHIVFGEVVKLRIGQLHRGGLRDTDIAEAVGWPLCDIETVLEGERCAPGPSDARPDPFEPTPGIPTAEEMSTDAATLQAGVDAMRQGSTSEPRGDVLARFEVVGEHDDKALRGYTEGDKHESTHDELTVNPDAWDLGTVITVTRGDVAAGPRVEPVPISETWRENAAAWVEEHGWNVLLMQARDVRAFARAMRGDASTIADVISETHRRPDEKALTRFSETLDLCAAKSKTLNDPTEHGWDIWETRTRLGRDDVLLFADAFEDLRRLRRVPRVDVEALRALLADMEGPDILTHSQACEVLSEAIGDTPSDPAPEPDLDERGWPEELSIRPEPLRSLLADLADGVRPIDREEVSRRIDEALRDPTPEQAEAESMLAAIRQVSIDRLGDVGGGCDLVTDIDSALARGRYFALESRRLRSALSRVGVELGSGNMDRAHEMAREALDAPGSDPDQTWIMTDEATTSGKALFRCSLCGAMNPAPARGHDCSAHLNLRTGPTLRDEPDGGAPTGPGWWRWKHHQHWVGVEVDGDLSFQLPHSGSRVLTAAFGGGWWGGRCQGVADAGAPTEPGWPNAPRTSVDLERLGLWWFTRPDRWTDGDVVWTPTRVLVDSHGQMWATFGPNRRTSVGCDSLAWGGPCRQGSADAGVLAIDGAERDGLPSIADLCVEIERTLDRADGVDATREAARATRYAKATREVQTRLDALVASVDLHHDEMRDHVAGGCTMNVPTMESEMEVLRTALAAAKAD